jgi:farnesyl diphosphate synthase
MMDLTATQAGDLDDVIRLQRLKTGALIGWCVEAGAVLGNAPAAERVSLRGYGLNLGLAFQIADDLLDTTGDESTAGKRLRKDAEAGKASFVSLVGADGARRHAQMLVDQAKDLLHPFGSAAFLLHAIADFAVTRDR